MKVQRKSKKEKVVKTPKVLDIMEPRQFKKDEKVFDKEDRKIFFITGVKSEMKGRRYQKEHVYLDLVGIDGEHKQKEVIGNNIIHFSDLGISNKIQMNYYTSLVATKPKIEDIEKQLIADIRANFVGTLSQIEAEIEHAKKKAQLEFRELSGVFENQSSSTLMKEFQLDLEKEFGLQNNSKKDVLYSIVSANAGNDLQEVYTRYAELVELIK